MSNSEIKLYNPQTEQHFSAQVIQESDLEGKTTLLTNKLRMLINLTGTNPAETSTKSLIRRMNRMSDSSSPTDVPSPKKGIDSRHKLHELEQDTLKNEASETLKTPYEKWRAAVRAHLPVPPEFFFQEATEDEPTVSRTYYVTGMLPPGEPKQIYGETRHNTILAKGYHPELGYDDFFLSCDFLSIEPGGIRDQTIHIADQATDGNIIFAEDVPLDFIITKDPSGEYTFEFFIPDIESLDQFSPEKHVNDPHYPKDLAKLRDYNRQRLLTELIRLLALQELMMS